MIKSYYDLLDQFGDNKEWVKKLEEDMGNHIAYLAVNMDETSRDELVLRSPYFARLDEEKQKFFR